LTVADVNQESTNLVTLQTRQQLALQSLSIATQSEQAVLRLFQ
jgi:flagellin-like hook-associated protein FlgL